MPECHRQGKHLLFNLPESEHFDSFLHDREREAEEAILLLAVHLRTLMELFSGKFSMKIKVFDYGGDEKMIGEISLKDIFDLLLHHRYFVIKGEYIIDLFSHKRGLSLEPSFGHRINKFELMDTVISLILEIKINDFIGILRSRLENLSAEAEPLFGSGLCTSYTGSDLAGLLIFSFFNFARGDPCDLHGAATEQGSIRPMVA